MRKRGFAAVELVASWGEIVGPAYAETTQPDRLVWPRRAGGTERFDEGVLTVRCTPSAALRLSHEMPAVVERINAFFGYRAVGRVRLLQAPLAAPARNRPRQARLLTAEEAARIAGLVDGVADDGLRASLERLGRAVLASDSPGSITNS